MKRGRWFLLVLTLLLLAGGVLGWTVYRRVRGEYDAYRALIQAGARVAGVDVGWLTPEEAVDKVETWVAAPYYRDFRLHYEDETLALSPREELGFEIPVDEMVAEAVATSHGYDYWQGFRLWIAGDVIDSGWDVPLRWSFDQAAAARYLEGVARKWDILAAEPVVDVNRLTFYPGAPGRRLMVARGAALINEQVPDPAAREVTLPVALVEPDQSPGRIEAMLSTLGPVMERLPVPPSFYTATLPISTTLPSAGETAAVTNTGELTWTLPHFASYTGPLTTTYGFFFDPGQPGAHFDVAAGVRQVEEALRAGRTEPTTFAADPVPPPPITPSLLLPPLEARLAVFPGVVSLRVKDLDSGAVIYDQNTGFVLAGMSVVKIGIMVEVYRYYGGEIDEQTHQELRDMLGSESCNPCANRLLTAVGGGNARTGAQKVTNTMRALGLEHFYLCAPFRIVQRPGDGREVATGQTIEAAPRVAALPGMVLQIETPRYDPCVRATPREMADLLEMIYDGAQGEGPLPAAYPALSPEVCRDMVEIMAANDLRNMLGAGIPAESKMAHKHGFAGYDVPWGDTRAEVGIVFPPPGSVSGTTWLVSYYLWDDTPWLNYGVVQPLYRDVSNLLYNYFNPLAPYWPLPQWVPEE